MGSLINHNGKIIPATQAVLFANNRAFRYGDGLFETLRVIRGNIPFLKAHYRRLVSGLALLQISIPASFTIDFFRKEILLLTGNNQVARVRFTAYRSEGGLYSPTDDHLQYLIEAQDLQQDKYKWNSNGLSTGLYPDIALTFSILSPLKSLNAIPYILASKYKQKNKLDDVFLINQQGRVAEATSSNVIIWNGHKLLTPSLAEACVAGVIRSVLLKKTKDSILPLEEKVITIADLKKANAVYITNSIQGIKWVNFFQEIRYDGEVAAEAGKELMSILNLAAEE